MVNTSEYGTLWMDESKLEFIFRALDVIPPTYFARIIFSNFHFEATNRLSPLSQENFDLFVARFLQH